MKHLKSFFEKKERINDVDVPSLLKDLSKEYDVKIRPRGESIFRKHYGERCDYVVAFAVCDRNIIYVREELLQDTSELLKTILHEVGHIHCVRNGIFKNYHVTESPQTPEEKGLYYSTALRAERWVDKWASNELKKWNRYLKYDFAYSDPKNVKLHRADLKRLMSKLA